MQDSLIKSLLTLLNHKAAGSKTIGPWLLTNEAKGYAIKRTLTPEGASSTKRTWQRLPIRAYKDIIENRKMLEELVDRLNYRSLSKQKEALSEINIRSSFITSEIRESFYKKLENEIPSKGSVDYIYFYVIHRFILFFDRLSPDPVEWHLKHQESWGQYLLSLNYSVSVLRKIIGAANRFMIHLHEKRKKEIPILVFRPLSPAVLRNLGAEKELIGQGREKRKYIPEADYNAILMNLPDAFKPIVILAYKYGLRRSEILGLHQDMGRVKRGYLFIDRQAKGLKNGAVDTKTTKNKLTRKVNHWCCSPEDCYELVQSIPLITRDNCTKTFDRIISQLFVQKLISYKYVLHDLRHTWISNAVKTHNINDVSRCAGHSDISVTNGYLKDTRDLDDELVIPRKFNG